MARMAFDLIVIACLVGILFILGQALTACSHFQYTNPPLPKLCTPDMNREACERGQ